MTRSTLRALACVLFLIGPFVSDARAAVIKTLDKFITIQPIQVCDDMGMNCAMNLLMGDYLDYTRDLYAMMGIRVDVLSANTLNSTDLQSTHTVASLRNATPNGANETPGLKALDMWFVLDLTTPNEYGRAVQGGDGAAIDATLVKAFNMNMGRLDTIGHEIGHMLGLDHTTFGAGGANNFMTSGATRVSPGTQFTSAQRTAARTSGFAMDIMMGDSNTTYMTSMQYTINQVPLPPSLAVLPMALAGLLLGARRRRPA